MTAYSMGEAQCALGNGLTSAFWNPAALAGMKHRDIQATSLVLPGKQVRGNTFSVFLAFFHMIQELEQGLL